MAKPPVFGVAIVGASIAGCTATTFFARRGARVALIERHSPYIPLEQAERQKQVFPHAEITVRDESGHWPFADDPGRVAELVVPFLRRQLGAS